MSSHDDPWRDSLRVWNALPITGFASPAERWRERPLRLDDVLVLHPHATYFMRASDHALHFLGIDKGDLVIIDRTLDLVSGAIILATLRGRLLLRRARLQGETVWLETEHPRYPAFAVTPQMHFALWGVALFVVQGLHPVFSLDACIQRYQQQQPGS